MFIKRKTYDHLRGDRDDLIVQNERLSDRLRDTQKELEQARDLKTVLEKLGSNHVNICEHFRFSGDLILPDDVARYVPDHFGGTVIRQEATKVIEISPTGDIKTGLTRRKPDTHYDYILIQKEGQPTP